MKLVPSRVSISGCEMNIDTNNFFAPDEVYHLNMKFADNYYAIEGELAGIGKVVLDPGQKAEVTCEITEPMLRFFNQANEKVSEAGKFIVMVGTSSRKRFMTDLELVI